MLLVIDVGNSNIVMGVFDGDSLCGRFRVNTAIGRTSDEYGVLIKSILRENGIEPVRITDAIISSVVPDRNHSIMSSIIKYLHVTPINIAMGVKTGIRIAFPNPAQVGADRIVDAAGAYYKYGGPLIVIDFGTATTYDLVDGEGAFITGITSPGIKISAKALWQDTAKLPEVELIKPDTIMAKDTVTSMQAGLLYGQIGQTEYIVKCLKTESGFTDAKVIATGGLGKLIAPETDVIEVYDEDLTLLGMKYIFDRNKKK